MNIDDLDISGIAYDSRKVKSGDVFVAIPGTKVDGYDFILQAVKNGARAIVAEKDFSSPPEIQKIVVNDARKALAELSSRFYSYPAKKLKLIGITGTNGKTTTAYLIESILKEAGYKVGLIGTIETRINGNSIPSSMTTPESLELQQLLSQMAREGATHVVMEVSSHSLAQERVYGLEFDAAIFTNLTHEHLDYHKNTGQYLESKKKLFKMIKSDGIALINVDDKYSKEIAHAVEGEISFYGIKDVMHELRATKQSEFDVRLKEYDIKLDMMRLRLDHTEIRTKLIGLYNIYNIIAAFQCGLIFNVSREIIKKGIEKAYVPGRFEKLDSKKGFSVVIDFAHTPDGLRKLLETVKPLTKGKLILVFGCSGDRDREKRPIMGKIAAEMADQVIVTTDDPHSENPQEIIDDILKGLLTIDYRQLTSEKRYIVHGPLSIVDREEAIVKAIELAHRDDIVIIAGRGHEKYQDFNGEKVELDDIAVVCETIDNN